MLSMDFGYCSRSDDETDKLTCLFLHDRSTKMMLAIPSPQKGGKYLQYLTTEVVRFIMQTQHREIAIKTDREPSILALTNAVRRACKSFGITVYDEAVQVGGHQANGAAEITVQVLRQKAGMWLQQVEDHVAGGKTLFSSMHPLYAWAMLHAGWVQIALWSMLDKRLMKGRTIDAILERFACLVRMYLVTCVLRKEVPNGSMVFGWARLLQVTCMLWVQQMEFS